LPALTRFKIIINLVLCALLLVGTQQASLASQSEQVVRFNQQTYYSDDLDQYYFSSLLRLALDETISDYGRYKLVPIKINMVQQRSISMIQANQEIDVLWTMTSKKREQQMKAVYVPLLKGLMGTRIFLIKKGEQDLFQSIKTLDDLKKLKAGQGTNWPDTEILKANQLPVQEAVGTLLHSMLGSDRFDYFPRAVTEITKELDEYQNLTVEKNFILRYSAPIYFFVNNNNELLAERLEVGLLRLLNSGKFDQHLQQVRNIASLVEKFNLNDRKVFQLHNPLMSEETNKLLQHRKFWFFH